MPVITTSFARATVLTEQASPHTQPSATVHALMPSRYRRRLIVAALASFTAFTALIACAPPPARQTRKHTQQALRGLETEGTELGIFPLSKVVDGDTIGVAGLDSTIRLIALDAEETFKKEAERRAYEAGWTSYLGNARGDSPRPVKLATPLGEAAKKFAREFFSDGADVKLERDNPREVRDRYDRYLAYAFVKQNGAWVNYNVEAVRAGMSPYFTKYGNSRRFHDQFVAAENEARAAKRGIWQPGAEAYQDYDERKAWWDARGNFVAAFVKDAEGKADHILINEWDAAERLRARIGKQAVVLGTVDDVIIGDRGPSRIQLARGQYSSIPAIVWDKDVLRQSGVLDWKGEYVIIRGNVQEYENPKSGRKQLQLVIAQPSQITLSPVPGLPAPPSVQGAQP